jgi:adenosylhomocysteine nucleosidase
MLKQAPIAIQVAVREELNPILKRLDVEEIFHEVTWEQRRSLQHAHHDHLRFYVGTLNGVRVVLFRTGVGRLRAREIIRIFFEHFESGCFISAGFGGALTPDLKVGDIVLATSICELQSGRCDWEGMVPSLNSEVEFRKGRLITADEMIIYGRDKARIGQDHQAVVVDMETSAVAALCHRRGVPMIGVRAISDRADEDLPPEINTFFDNGQVRPAYIVRAIAAHPPTVIGLFRLAKNVWRAGDDLAVFLEKLVRVVPVGDSVGNHNHQTGGDACPIQTETSPPNEKPSITPDRF